MVGGWGLVVTDRHVYLESYTINSMPGTEFRLSPNLKYLAKHD